MNAKTRQKLANVYELVKRGVDGEKDAAQAALDRLMRKYNISDEALDDLTKMQYRFKYSTNLEQWLMMTLIDYFLEGKEVNGYRDLRGKRELVLTLEYLDYILISTAYEYYRKHMRVEYNKVVAPELARCRKVKTRNKKRAYLQNLFFSRYVIASKLYKEGELKKIDPADMSESELSARLKMSGVQGGEYNTQVTTGLYLD